jgi:hypothetical protein
MTASLRVRRTRGALSGVLLVLLGLWGALIPFIGPYFHYAYTPNQAWHYTSGRLWLELLPGAAVVLGGIIVLGSRHRLIAVLGAWLAAAGGAWFTVGGLVASHWTQLPSAGTPVGGPARMVVEQIGFFTGLGVVIAFVAGLAMGRFTVVAARDLAVVAPVEPAVEPVAETPVETTTGTPVETTTEPAEVAESRPVRRLTLPRPLVRSGASTSTSSDVDADTEPGTGSD